MTTNYMAYDFKNGDKTDRFMLKVTDYKIDDLFLARDTRVTPDECLEFRLENGALREEFLGKDVERDFLSAQLRERGEDCSIRQYRVSEKMFRDSKIAANMLTVRGESTGKRFLETLRHETRHAQNRVNMALMERRVH